MARYAEQEGEDSSSLQKRKRRAHTFSIKAGGWGRLEETLRRHVRMHVRPCVALVGWVCACVNFVGWGGYSREPDTITRYQLAV